MPPETQYAIADVLHRRSTGENSNQYADTLIALIKKLN